MFFFFSVTNNEADAWLPKNLNGAPQIENEKHHWLVLHFFHGTKNDEQDEIPSNHLVKGPNIVITLQMYFLRLQKAGVTAHESPYLYKSWSNACPDKTKSSVEDLHRCQDLAEEHHVRYGVKCIGHRI